MVVVQKILRSIENCTIRLNERRIVVNNIFKIKLSSVNNAALFVKKCGSFEEDIDYIHGRYVIDAKSIMGIMSTDLGESAKVEIHTNDIEIINKFKEEISLWMEDK